MRAALAIAAACTLVGCGYHMTPELFTEASQMCAPHGGLTGADRGISGFSKRAVIYASCKDGSRVERVIELKEQP